jgi:hypothetical protein
VKDNLPMARRVAQTLLAGLDLNATCARAVAAAAGESPWAIALDGPHADLPLALSLEGRAVEAGRAGAAVCRRSPHLACVNFLPELGGARSWTAGRHHLDADTALHHVLAHLQHVCRGVDGLALALPVYLTPEQMSILGDLGEQTGLALFGSVPAPLATALAAHAERPWSGLALVLDIDDHALTWSAVAAGDDQGWLVSDLTLPSLGLRVWKERLLEAVARRCVRHTRRDPRAVAAAEQSLWDQLDRALDANRCGRLVELAIETPHWYQNVVLQPGELAGFTAALTRQTLEALQRFTEQLPAAAGAVLVTATAGRLPGLVDALQECISPPPLRDLEMCEDFGEGLLDADLFGDTGVKVLDGEAPARAACLLAGLWQDGDLPPGHLEVAPLLPPQPVDSGPARLHFRGQDFVLPADSFVLGHHLGCDLVLDGARYPAVSSRHCEILYDRRAYLLRDRSHHGTWVNDHPVRQQVSLRPGDWICLGPATAGPALRFLGKPAAQQGRLTTSA